MFCDLFFSINTKISFFSSRKIAKEVWKREEKNEYFKTNDLNFSNEFLLKTILTYQLKMTNENRHGPINSFPASWSLSSMLSCSAF